MNFIGALAHRHDMIQKINTILVLEGLVDSDLLTRHGLNKKINLK